MARDTRRRIVTTTAKLLQRQGYHGTGLNQILTESGAPKGSMYFHFPGGKDQLAAEAITVSARYLDAALDDHRRATAAESLDTYLTDVAAVLTASDYAEGCPIATVALEVGPTVPIIADACHDAYTLLVQRVAGWLRDDGIDAATAEQHAFIIYAAIEGALMFAKAQRSIEPIQRLRTHLPLLLPQRPTRRARHAAPRTP